MILCFHAWQANIIVPVWSDWQNFGLQNCTLLHTLCLAFELLDLSDLASDRWKTLLHLIQQAPPNVLNLHITFHPMQLSMKQFCQNLGEQDCARLLDILRTHLQQLRILTLELISNWEDHSLDVSSTELVWKRYGGDAVQNMIAQSFKGNGT